MLRTINKYLDKQILPLVENAENNQTIIYTSGVFGRGVIVENERDRALLIGFLKSTMLLALLSGALSPMMLHMPWQYVIAALGACLIVHLTILLYISRGLERTPPPMCDRRRLQRFAVRMGRKRISFNILLSAFLLPLAGLCSLSGKVYLGAASAVIMISFLAFHLFLLQRLKNTV